MKKIVILITLIIFSFSSAINISTINTQYSWYCKQNNQHNQPILSNELKFAENYDLYWKDNKCTRMKDDKKIIYLTFDAGYENGNVEKILNILKEEGVTASFFILDNILKKNTELIVRMINEGHLVCNHTMRHRDMSKINCKDEFLNELESLNKLYLEKTGKQMPKFYRPPEGKFSEDNLKWAKELGYKTIMWSFAYDDWDNNRQKNEEYAYKKIMDNIHNGEVMLLHPTSETNVKVLGRVIRCLKEQGFEFGDLYSLCDIK